MKLLLSCFFTLLVTSNMFSQIQKQVLTKTKLLSCEQHLDHILSNFQQLDIVYWFFLMGRQPDSWSDMETCHNFLDSTYVLAQAQGAFNESVIG